MTHPHHIALVALLLACPSLATAQLLNLSGKGVGFELAPKPKQPTQSTKPQPKALATPTADVETAQSDTKAELPGLAVCQCRGSNRQVCYCLKAKVKCGCNPQKGSEWRLDPLSKTGRYFDPNKSPVPAREQESSGGKESAEPVSYPVTVDAYDRLAWRADGVVWTLDAGYRMANGQKDGTGRWLFKSWRMIDTSSRPVEAVNAKQTAKIRRRGIYFGATWCGPCRWVKANTLPQLTNFTIEQVDADRNPGLLQRYGITSLPTLVIIEGDREVDRIIGQFSAAQARNALQSKRNQ